MELRCCGRALPLVFLLLKTEDELNCPLHLTHIRMSKFATYSIAYPILEVNSYWRDCQKTLVLSHILFHPALNLRGGAESARRRGGFRVVIVSFLTQLTNTKRHNKTSICNRIHRLACRVQKRNHFAGAFPKRQVTREVQMPFIFVKIGVAFVRRDTSRVSEGVADKAATFFTEFHGRIRFNPTPPHSVYVLQTCVRRTIGRRRKRFCFRKRTLNRQLRHKVLELLKVARTFVHAQRITDGRSTCYYIRDPTWLKI